MTEADIRPSAVAYIRYHNAAGVVKTVADAGFSSAEIMSNVFFYRAEIFSIFQLACMRSPVCAAALAELAMSNCLLKDLRMSIGDILHIMRCEKLHEQSIAALRVAAARFGIDEIKPIVERYIKISDFDCDDLRALLFELELGAKLSRTDQPSKDNII